MNERILTCIVCPRGCTLKVSLDGENKVLSVEGNACKRGEKYANDECTHPLRTVTSTVRCESGAVVAVKTSESVPKELVFDVMREINSVIAPSVVKVGDVIIKNVLGTSADVVATANTL